MQDRLKNLVDAIVKEHPEILTYYELSSKTGVIDVQLINSAYGMPERCKVEPEIAWNLTYLAIKILATKQSTIDRLEREYQDVISRIR